MIVRSCDPIEIVSCLHPTRLPHIPFVQLLSASADISVLELWGEGIPIDVVLNDPAVEFSSLYGYATLRETHPVRVTVPVVPGFGKAVRVALALGFAVKLTTNQPNPALISELEEIVDFYLHGSNVQQPVEFFQTLFMSFYRPLPVSLWELNEEDPAQVRYITDEGEETISPRFAGSVSTADLNDFVPRFGAQLLAEKRECHTCDFYNRCGGYFKWPDKTYSCEGIKKLFNTLRSAAAELQCDLNAFAALERGLNL